MYTYTPSGRLQSEVRTGQVAYSRNYEYNPDGSRYSVSRSDALNGSHWELYLYDEVSGRLESVLDLRTGEVNEFEWNPEGTLARWTEPNAGYDRVFGYDEEGRLVRIERDYGNGNKQVAYEYGYNSDGGKVWKRDYLNQQEYRYLCRIGCGGTPMRVYVKEFADTQWFTLSSTHAHLATIIGGNQFRLIVRQVGSVLSFMSIDSLHLPALVYRDHLGLPFGSIIISNPSFIIPKDYPSQWMPNFPRLPYPTRPILPRSWLPFFGIIGIVGVGIYPSPEPVPAPPGENPPVPAPPITPPTFPSPPNLPHPSDPSPPTSACEKLEECREESGHNIGECMLDCLGCCVEMCGPAAYSACAAGCFELEPDDCGVTVIDPPDVPEDIWEWLEKICEVLTAWEVIPDIADCKTIRFIPFL